MVKTAQETAMCVGCGNETDGAHKYQNCDLNCHIICGSPVGEEGYGQSVVCPNCLKSRDNDETRENSEIRTQAVTSISVESLDSGKSSSKSVIDLVDETVTGDPDESGGSSLLPATIPPNLYLVITETGRYIIEMMKFSGYSDLEGVSRLRDEKELENMFSFMREMAETIDDEDQLKKLFWHILENSK